MRVAIVTESFLPQVNGVTGSVLKVVDHLRAQGHQALVVAPGPGPSHHAPSTGGPVRVVRIPSAPLPGYAEQRVAVPGFRLAQALHDFRPDVVHLAAPAVLGAQAATLAQRAGVPAVAVYQTDLPGYARRYGWHGASQAVWGWLRRVHEMAARTLAPSRHACAELVAHGFPDVSRWPRGVDVERFHPRFRDDDLHRRFAPRGELLVGYVGRLAKEKELDLLRSVHAVPGVRLVVAGHGPQRAHLRRVLPGARFLGMVGGRELSRVFASLDVFVHTGRHETFCQTAQEALASGVPVVAPAAGGLLDIVDPGVNGVFFTPGDRRGLREAVEGFRDDGAARAALAGRARASVAGRDWHSVGQDLLANYRAIAA
ncbi:glycosyltransferase family 4 protein [Kineococcus sp. SYSU DK002]|uniref:glycosyltransferase family 4 protein n=1 Tax=Kineococcus sp. SYSU DK002 TaxID=3383123 RepID=UPI003D7E100B